MAIAILGYILAFFLFTPNLTAISTHRRRLFSAKESSPPPPPTPTDDGKGKREKHDEIMAKTEQIQKERIESRSERLEKIYKQVLERTECEKFVKESSIFQPNFANKEVEDYTKVVNNKLYFRGIQGTFEDKINEKKYALSYYLWGDEQILGNEYEPVRVAILGYHRLEESEGGICEKADLEYGCQNCPPIIKIQVIKDPKLQKAIEMFRCELEYAKENGKDPYLALAKYVSEIFEKNTKELSLTEELEAKNWKSDEIKPIIYKDDMYLSGKVGVFLGDMLGSYHTCAPSGVLVKVIADAYGMPCRFLATPTHVWNMVPNLQNEWKILDVAQLNYDFHALSGSTESQMFVLSPKDVYEYPENVEAFPCTSLRSPGEGERKDLDGGKEESYLKKSDEFFRMHPIHGMMTSQMALFAISLVEKMVPKCTASFGEHPELLTDPQTAEFFKLSPELSELSKKHHYLRGRLSDMDSLSPEVVDSLKADLVKNIEDMFKKAEEISICLRKSEKWKVVLNKLRIVALEEAAKEAGLDDATKDAFAAMMLRDNEE